MTKQWCPTATYQSIMADRSSTPHDPGTTNGGTYRGSVDAMTSERPLVAVIDDDESVRESLPDLLSEFGYAVRAFASAEEFLASHSVGETRCLILDIVMPGMSGPDLHQELTLRRQQIPIVFISAHADETVRSRLLGQGAVACLSKPFSEAALLEAINAALRVD
jgi:FixJ family two-component response regulator